jgi:serine/threonine protein kinase
MRELILSYEVWHEDSDTFDHSITVWKDGENYYQINHPARRGKFDLDSLPIPPSPIPLVIFKGHWHSSLTECPHPLPLDSYQKSPDIMLDDHNGETPGEIMLREAETYEILKQYPHPNICHYYGCIRDGQYLTAICLRKYKHTLSDAVRSGAALDHNIILSGIAKGLQFLHDSDTLGLVHNDIKPTNIMPDDKGHPVIIDFDSCAKIGQDLEGRKKVGTIGWVRKPEPLTSTIASDEYALSLIAQFLDGKVDSGGFPLPPDVSILISFISSLLRTDTVLELSTSQQ